jgi:group II intron reverse transcriptase/maturase
MRTTDPQLMTETKLKRIAWLSAMDHQREFNNLMHLYNLESLVGCFNELDGRKAVGADGITKEAYREKLGQNLTDLIARMKRMAYIPGPVRQVLIPKEGKPGAKRPLGIGNLEDKIVQKMTQKVLESIYEPIFLKCSYGFRPELGCHDAIRALRDYLYRNDVRTVIDVDLANFFGTIDHKQLEIILRKRIKDETFIRYLIRMFKAGVLTDGELTISDEGVPQGSPCSPVLANIFAHYVLDDWFENIVKAHCRGQVEMFRYCDDFVICCQYDSDTKRIKKVLGKRLSKYGLKLNEEKTKLVPFSGLEASKGFKQDAFDFLGFTLYLGFSKAGQVIPKVKTIGKRYRSKLKKVNDWCREMRNQYKLKEIWKRFCIKLAGHIQYYGVSFNSKRVSTFCSHSIHIFFKWINRRSQRRSFSWDKFNLFMKKYPPPKARVCHSLF